MNFYDCINISEIKKLSQHFRMNVTGKIGANGAELPASRASLLSGFSASQLPSFPASWPLYVLPNFPAFID